MSSTGALTKKTITALVPEPGAQYVRWDGKLAGFGVRVSPAGAKTFVYKYRLKSGRVRWATLGRFDATNPASVEKARKRAQEMLGDVAKGNDPLREIDAAKGAVTLSATADEFLTYIEESKKPPTARLYRLAIDSHIRPRLGSIPIAEVGPDDALKLKHRLRATPTMANRTIAVLSSLLSWCAKARKNAPNPCEGIEKYPERKRKRYLDGDEYARIGKALREVPMQPGPRTAIQLLLLTGARPSEIATLKWDHVNLKRGALELPDSKTGEKTIYLSAAAVKLLKKWPRFAKSPFVFPGNGRKPKGEHIHGTTLAHIWADVRKAAKLEDVRLYDACRHSYASMALSKHGLTLAQIGEQLGHSQAATTKRYAHIHDDIARANATAVGGGIAAAMKRKAR